MRWFKTVFQVVSALGLALAAGSVGAGGPMGARTSGHLSVFVGGGFSRHQDVVVVSPFVGPHIREHFFSPGVRVNVIIVQPLTRRHCFQPFVRQSFVGFQSEPAFVSETPVVVTDPPRRTWVPGFWERSGQERIWVPGHWAVD